MRYKNYVHKERKEITHVKIGERTVITTSNIYIYIYIYIYINKYKVCYHNMITRSKVHEQCIQKRKKRKKIHKDPHYITQNMNTLPNKNLLY